MGWPVDVLVGVPFLFAFPAGEFRKHALSQM